MMNLTMRQFSPSGITAEYFSEPDISVLINYRVCRDRSEVLNQQGYVALRQYSLGSRIVKVGLAGGAS